ncbi:flagellar basal body P-ring formation protein FlgA [Massilia sp. CCM 8695]|uniref:Flagellar basal body P-ring formation protein FlgA n=1 Tax=Massilia frigida TaxID=2609281 RepID=A0ABX0NI59_9BURK|nr:MULTISPECIES: flagellar basal body P-ring formation chaperone FlgA [Massilia]MDM5179198.1 flagellar basal body P-ring formation chaperone FlgA [Massilia sp. DJPM01]NHZ80755.1 flagellar basal body P-ring formation protein FlgA [Massilia frigida]
MSILSLRPRLRALTLLAACALPLLSRAAAPVQLVLRADATVRGAEIVLADLLTVAAADAALQNALEALRVGPAPRVGAVEQYARAELERLMHARALPAGATLAWSGARAVKVRAAERQLGADALQRAASEALRQHLGGRYADAELRVAGNVPDLALPLGEPVLSTRIVDPTQLRARQAVYVDVAVGGKPVRSVLVPFTVKLTRMAYVARRDLAPGTVLGPNDVEQRPEDVVQVADSMLPVAQLAPSARTVKAVARGQVVLLAHVAQQGLVYRGDTVRLVLAEGAVSIETRAVAQQDGGMGQLVRVKPEAGMEAISARVLGAGLVQAEGK